MIYAAAIAVCAREVVLEGGDDVLRRSYRVANDSLQVISYALLGCSVFGACNLFFVFFINKN